MVFPFYNDDRMVLLCSTTRRLLHPWIHPPGTLWSPSSVFSHSVLGSNSYTVTSASVTKLRSNLVEIGVIVHLVKTGNKVDVLIIAVFKVPAAENPSERLSTALEL